MDGVSSSSHEAGGNKRGRSLSPTKVRSVTLLCATCATCSERWLILWQKKGKQAPTCVMCDQPGVKEVELTDKKRTTINIVERYLHLRETIALRPTQASPEDAMDATEAATRADAVPAAHHLRFCADHKQMLEKDSKKIQRRNQPKVAATEPAATVKAVCPCGATIQRKRLIWCVVPVERINLLTRAMQGVLL